MKQSFFLDLMNMLTGLTHFFHRKCSVVFGVSVFSLYVMLSASAALIASIVFIIPIACAVELPIAIGADGNTLETADETPWRIFADELVSLNDGVVIEGKGNVLLVRGNDYLKADFARLYTNTQWILLRGNVFAKLGQDEVKATEAEFDLSNSSGWVKDANIFMAGPHLYFSSKELYKTKVDSYHLKDAIVTACDGESPLWSINAAEVNIDADNYASFTDSVFNIKDKSVIYSPYLVVPTKTTRQTGFLQPEYGLSSEAGLYYTQPWFYAIDQSRDLTLYGTILTKKGFMPSIEYRAHTKENQKVWAAFDFLYENDVVRTEMEDSVDSSDGKIRKNELRYWARAMGNGDISESDWNYKFNLDYVSDQNFLREYQNRMTGFDSSREESYKMFGRDFMELDQNRVSEGYIYRNWDRFTVTGGIRFEQDPSLGNGNKPYSLDNTVQSLPEFYAFWNKGKIIDQLPFEVNGFARTGYMFRQEGTSGFRTELYPQLSLPIDLRYASMEVSAGARATLYNNTDTNRNSPVKEGASRKLQDGKSRVIPEFGVNFYTQATRTWEWPSDLKLSEKSVGESKYTGMRHFMQPRVSYSWIDDVDQESNPFYLREDRIQNSNNVVFSLDNHFTFRQESVEKGKDGLSLRTNYRDLFRVKLSSGYDFREADRKQYVDIFENRPWHDVRLRLDMNPYPWLSLNANAYYSLYDNHVSRLDSGITLRHSRYGQFSSSYSLRELTYNYREIINFDNPADIIGTEPLDVITNSILLNITPKVQVFATERTNLENGKSFERIVGIGVLHQCVRVFGEYIKDAQEEIVSLNVEFLGLSF